MILNSPFISGSLTVTGNTILSGSITSLAGIAGTASYATNAEMLDGLDSTSFTTTSSFDAASSSFSTRVANTESTASAFVAASASFSTRLTTDGTSIASINAKTGSYATTGSNQFNGSQTVTGSLTATGTIVAQTLVVQTITSSVDFVTGSTRFGSTTGNTHQFTGSVLVSGSQTVNGTLSGAGAIFTNTVQSNDQNAFWLLQSSNTTDTKYWAIQNLVTSGNFRIRALNDAVSNGINAIDISRTGISSVSIALGGALSGTSATFSSTLAVTIGGAGISLTGTVGSNSYYVMDQTPNSGGKRWRFGHTGAIGGFGSFDFYNQTDNITALTLASTGAATFSSSVTATGVTAKSTVNYGGFIADNSSSATIGGGYFAASSFGVQRALFAVAGAISGTTDNNAGIFAESGLGIKFFVNGSGTASHMMTSAGNVGIGTTAPKLNGNSGTFVTIDGGGSASGWLELTTSSTTDGLGGSITFNNNNIVGADKRNAQIVGARDGANNSGRIEFLTWNAGSAAERMRITSGGTLQVNNNSTNGVVGTNFQAFAVSSNSFFRLGNNTNNSLNIQLTRSDSATMFSVDGHSGASTFFGAATFSSSVTAGGDVNITTGAYRSQGEIVIRRSGNEIRMGSGDASDYLVYYAGAAERMRINSAGRLIVGATSDGATGLVQIHGTARAVQLHASQGGITAGNYAIYGHDDDNGYINIIRSVFTGDFHFRFDGTTRSNINRSTGVYTATSDSRLKTNISDSQNVLSLIDQIKVRSYNWIESNVHEPYGLVAQELHEILPQYVYEPKNENENWGLSKSELVPMLIKAIQELSTKNDALEARLAALESAQ